MSGSFKVGEVLVGVNFITHPDRNDMECIVIGGLDVSDAILVRTGEVVRACATYEVEWADGFVDNVQPKNLRRKQPPTGLATVLAWFTAPAPREVEAA